MKIVFLYLFLFCAKTSFSQNFNPHIKLTGSFKMVDSQYLIIPHLRVFKDNQGIKIHKKLVYGNEANPTADCIFILQKALGNTYVNVYWQTSYDLIPDSDYFLLTKFTTKSKLSDTLNLNTYYPFEAGSYRLLMTLNYYIKNVKRQVNSEWINFQVP